ncbi:MAG: DUF1858 domain-containing protein [Bacillota bacterium]|nr:DUF1858 domain-containing protein [Bacillota bacterium]
MQITEEMTIREALMLNPRTAEVFLRYGMHCLGCPSATGESIGAAAQSHGIDINTLLQELNEVLNQK